ATMATNCGKIGTSIIELSQVRGLFHLYSCGVGRLIGLLFCLPIPSAIALVCCAVVMSSLPAYSDSHVLSKGRNGPVGTDARDVEFGDAPVITGQRPVHTAEEQAVTIGFGDLIVEDADSNYPAGFTIQVAEGPNYTVSSDRTVVPATDYNGTL